MLRRGIPPVMLAGGRRGAAAGVGGIPKPWTPGPLRSGPEVPTVTPPPGPWGWGRDLGSAPAGLRTPAGPPAEAPGPPALPPHHPPLVPIRH